MSTEDTNSQSATNPWFEGSVAVAVQRANTDGSVLMVCLIQGMNGLLRLIQYGYSK